MSIGRFTTSVLMEKGTRQNNHTYILLKVYYQDYIVQTILKLSKKIKSIHQTYKIIIISL